jgi:toxin CcdB
MARFDVYRITGVQGYVVDVQANFLSQLETRIVVPLMLAHDAPHPAARLNPQFRVGDDDVVMATQFMAAVPRGALSATAASLSDHRDEIVTAIDFLMQGF